MDAEEFPPGHFYSPVVDRDDVAARGEQIWPDEPMCLGIDFDDDHHRHVLTEVFAQFIGDYDFPETEDEITAPHQYFTQNSQFSWLDSRALFVLLRHWRPRRIIEVGSGFSSLLMADVNQRFLDGTVDITCIEPYPRPFLVEGQVPGLARVIVDKVQDVALDEYQRLQAGDILFIDSSHVSKTGSDVNHLYFEVLPRLAAGVRIHVHDIFLPDDYPAEWVLFDKRSWNEQYVLRALLMYSSAFAVRFGCAYALHRFGDEVASALGRPAGQAFGGGSIWLEKIA
jgi:hypothetical protein